jgi:outer membrane protein
MTRILLLLIVLLSLATSAMAASPSRIGVVDLQRAVSESTEGIEAKSALLRKAEQFNADLKVLLADFEKMRAEAEKDAAGLSADERSEREKVLQKKSRDFQSRQREAQEDLKQIEAEYLRKITARLGTIMSKVGEEENYTAILDRSSGLYYFSREADITSLIVKRANEEYSRSLKK